MGHYVKSIINVGSHGVVIETECHLSKGLPAIVLVGLGNKAVEEAKERLRSAFASTGIQLPRKRITINLAPADVPKNDTGLDLAIAVAILAKSGSITRVPTHEEAFIGEIGLDGTIRSVRGIIGKILAAKQHGISTFYIPSSNLSQAQLVPGITLVPLESIYDMYRSFNGERGRDATTTTTTAFTRSSGPLQTPTLSLISGQLRAKRALEIAAAGGHNLFITGAPGTGKSMLAKALPSLLPPMNQEETLETTHLHSLISPNYESLITERPFRAPHHSSSYVALVGGGSQLRPGEISLSHRGVLFLDEIPEFSRISLEALRQPLEDGAITVARARDTAIFPANFILIATANPCPCGYYGSKKECECAAHMIARYRQRVSGPIMDRFDLYVVSDEIEHAALLQEGSVEEDDKARQRVLVARKAQFERYQSASLLNKDLTNQSMIKFISLDKTARSLLDTAATQLSLSARSYMRVLKVARTIADLEQSASVAPSHIGEALQYRSQKLAQQL